MYKEGDKVVVIFTVEEAQRVGDKYLTVAYDEETVIEVDLGTYMPLTDSLELEFLEYQQKLIESAIKDKRACLDENYRHNKIEALKKEGGV